jgi:multidrug efflux pump subunit AcrA (membrane-fusion protein)
MKSFGRTIRRWRGWLIFLLIVVLVGFFALNNRGATAKPLSDQATTTVQKHDVVRNVSVEGQLSPQDKRDVYFPTQSKVKELNFGTGMLVNKDDVLAEIAVSTGSREVRSEIKAPISGLITQTNYKVDDQVTTLPGFVIQNLDQLFVEVQVNENDIIDIVAGQKVKITLPALSLEQTYPGEVVNVYPAPSDAGGAIAYPVRVKLSKIPAGVRVGMSADLEIITAQAANALSIPDSYIIEKNDKYFVKTITWLNVDHTEYEVAEQEVLLGLRSDEYTEIKSGLTEGQELVQPNFVTQRQFSFFGR